MEEKMVTIFIDEYPRRCPESKVQKVLENIEQTKKYFLEKGVSKEQLEKMYSVRIVRDGD